MNQYNFIKHFVEKYAHNIAKSPLFKRYKSLL